MEQRKKDHIDLAFQSQIASVEADQRFYYEPVMKPHMREGLQEFEFLGKTIRVPIWVSSMTGGTKLANKINHNLAKACQEFGMGMGLGSCRSLLSEDTYFNDFNVRHVIGSDLPLYANLGVAQVEELLLSKSLDKILVLTEKLKADGLIIHVNPLQESLQPEGDLFSQSPLETIEAVVSKLNIPVMVKAVGQGMGPESLKYLMKLPLVALEYGAFGGTNFARLELLRSESEKRELFEPLAKIGHDANQMTGFVNDLVENKEDIKCGCVIVSGGIRSFLDGYYLINRLKLPAVYGQASAFLKYAKEDYQSLRKFIQYQVQGLEIANAFLKVKT